MRDVGDEILAHALQAAKFGDIVKHDNGSGRFSLTERLADAGGVQRFYGSGGDGKTLRLSDAHGDVALQAFFAAQGATNQADEFGIADDFDERAALGAGGVHIQNFRKRAIVKDEALLRVNDGDAFDHAAQDGAGSIAFAAQQADFAVHSRGGLVERVGEIGKLVARAFAEQGTEITFGDALGKSLQALDARGKHARESEGDADRR